MSADRPSDRNWIISNFPGLKGELQSFSKAVRDKYQALWDLFLPNPESGKIQHTNLEPGVRLSEDDPFLKPSNVNSAGMRSIELAVIPPEIWTEKYESEANIYAPKVQHVDKTKSVANQKEYYSAIDSQLQDGFISTNPISNLPTSLNFDATRWPGPGGPPALSYLCNGTTQYNNVPGTYVPPWSLMSGNPSISSVYEIINWYSINVPGNISIRQCRFNYPPSNCNQCGAVCDNVYLGISYKQQWVNYFSAEVIGVDPVTGSLAGATASSLQPSAGGGYWYDTWVELMDDLIAAGEYVGNNTDSMEDLWNAGIFLGFQANGCTNCNPTPPTPAFAGYCCTDSNGNAPVFGCENASANCGGNDCDGVIAVCLECVSGCGLLTYPFTITYDVDLINSGGVVIQQALGMSVIINNASELPFWSQWGATLCVDTYTVHYYNLVIGGTAHGDLNVSCIVLGDTPLSCPADPSCCVPSWDCVSPGNCQDPGTGQGQYTTQAACLSACVTPSWDCVNGACIDPGTGNGAYTSLTACQASCSPPPEPGGAHCLIKPCDEH